MVSADFPYGDTGAANKDEKHPSRDVGFSQVLSGNIMFALPHPAVDDRNIVRLGIAPNATTETAGHPHQVGVIQGFIRPGQRPPPGAESSGSVPHAEISIENDSVYTIVATGEEILIELAESVRHSVAKVPHATILCNCDSG